MSIDFSGGPLPDVTLDEFRPFWEAARTGSLKFPRCRACGLFHWYPEVICPHCQSNDIEWAPVKGEGKVYTWTVVRHTFDQSFAKRIPMIVALIEFDDAPGIRLVTNLVKCKPEEIQQNMPVKVIFKKVNEQVTMPVFEPVVS